MTSLAEPVFPAPPAWPWQGVALSVLVHLVAALAIKGPAPTHSLESARLSVALVEPAAPPLPASPRSNWVPRPAPAATTPQHTTQPSPALEADAPRPAGAAVLTTAEPAPMVAANPPPAAVAPPAPTPPSAPVADSAWLSRTLFQLMSERKRYPRRALQSGLEGRVVIEATLNDRGEVLSARVVESAGSEILDQDALALLRAVTPLKVDQALAPQTRVRVPLRYALEE